MNKDIYCLNERATRPSMLLLVHIYANSQLTCLWLNCK